jgi:P-type Cu+ transporter
MDMSGKVLAVSGTTSTAAMISCCAHYLANILPVIGIAGAVALIAQYQIELFWFGLGCNLAGIAYMGIKVAKFSQAHQIEAKAHG